MRKVIKNNELRKIMDESIDMLCDTVKSTLGPKGCNSIIDHSAFSPFITNDGVTIASNIESEDEAINTILTLAKEASINTNNQVGDGTTTTLVLLQSIYKSGRKLIDNGINSMILKKELDLILNKVIKLLDSNSWVPKKREIINVVSTTSGSNSIGALVSEVYFKVGSKNAIKVMEGSEEETKVVYKNGYIIESMIVSSYYFNNKENIELNDVYVVLINNYIDNIEEISDIINMAIYEKKELVIFAEDYSQEVINNIISMYLDKSALIYLFRIPGYGIEKVTILEDLSLISGAKVKRNDIEIKDVGKFENININKEEVICSFTINDKIKEVIKSLEEKNDEVSIKRLTMLKGEQAIILVGARTVTERREKKMRYEDAICALGALRLVCLGGGVTLYKISEELNDTSSGALILKNALKEVLLQIIDNSGLDRDIIINEIKKSNYTKVYNVISDKYESVNDTSVIDVRDVLVMALKNALSIASMLLTTTSLVINENINNLGKVSEYQ